MQGLPDNAKKVFSGKIFDVYQWEQEQFDGSFQTFEKLARADTVQAICITPDNKFLITTEEQPGKPPFKALPGGRCERGEAVEVAVARELLEETGMKGDKPELWLVNTPYGKIRWSIHTFIIRNCQVAQQVKLDAGEKINVQLTDFEGFVDTIISDPLFFDTFLSLNFARAKLDGKLDELKQLFLHQ